MQKVSFLLLFGLMFVVTTFAQKKPKIQFGKVSLSDFLIQYKQLDSLANAVVIYDGANSKIDFVSGKNEFQVITERHLRILVLTKEGLDYGNFELSLYKNGLSKEELMEFKGATFILDQGEVKESKFARKSLLEENTSEHYTTIKASFPNVVQGAIIDMEYTVNSDFLHNIPTWYFQKKIPVLISEYYIAYPEYFDFYLDNKGYFQVTQMENKVQGMTTSYSSDLVNIVHKAFQAVQIPPFKEEAYSSAPENFLASLNCELRSVSFPNQPVKYFTQTWEDIQQILKEDEEFGLFLKKGNQVKDLLPQFQGLPEQDKPEAVYNYVKNNYLWNGKRGLWADRSLREILDKKEGNVGAKNLLLTLLLKELGYKASPMLLSTIDHGWVYPTHPTIESFNYVVTVLRFNEQDVFLDASDKDLSFGIIPYHCFNGQGRLVDPERFGWLDMQPKESFKKRIVYELQIQADKSALLGVFKENYSGYDAIAMRSQIHSFTTHDEFQRDLEKEQTGLKIDSFHVKGLEEKGTLEMTFKVAIDGYLEQVDDLLFFKPFLYEMNTKNPFSLNKREYPVEFIVPINESIYSKITLPEGMDFETFPEKQYLTLNGDGAKFIYEVKKIDDRNALFTSRIDIKQTTFLPEEYEPLKSFFQNIVKKHDEPVVIKTKK